jgi:hypothetical protein
MMMVLIVTSQTHSAVRSGRQTVTCEPRKGAYRQEKQELGIEVLI